MTCLIILIQDGPRPLMPGQPQRFGQPQGEPIHTVSGLCLSVDNKGSLQWTIVDTYSDTRKDSATLFLEEFSFCG